jgi:hypothetical protein
MRAVAARVEGRALRDTALRAQGFTPLTPFRCRQWSGDGTPRYAALCRVEVEDRDATGRAAFLDLVLFDQPGGPAAFRRFFHERVGAASIVTTATLTLTPPDGDARFEEKLPIECVKSAGTPSWCIIPIGSRAAVVSATADNGRGNETDMMNRARRLAQSGSAWAFFNADERVKRLFDLGDDFFEGDPWAPK